MDRKATAEERFAILTEFLRKMEHSGYSPTQREQVLKSGLQGYMNMIRAQRTGLCPIIRLRGRVLDAERIERKLTVPVTWFLIDRKPDDTVVEGEVAEIEAIGG